MINNRQNGRNNRRGRNNNPRPMGGGQGPRPDAGNRIDSRQRGNAHQLHEKYKNLARDSQTQGDRVTAEYYLQFADHYFRVLNEHRARQEEQRDRQRQFDSRYEENEGEDGADNAGDDATAPIAISGLPPAIGNATFSDASDDDGDQSGNAHDARREDSRPRSAVRGRGRPPRARDEESAGGDNSADAEGASEAPVRRRPARKPAASSPQLELTSADDQDGDSEEAAKPRRRVRRTRPAEDTVAADA